MEAAHGPEAIRKHVRIYIAVFVALACLTIITVGISYLHLARGPAIALALVVASIKASLVAAYFMHLLTERKVIYWVLALTATFFVLLIALPSFTTFEGHPG